MEMDFEVDEVEEPPRGKSWDDIFLILDSSVKLLSFFFVSLSLSNFCNVAAPFRPALCENL